MNNPNYGYRIALFIEKANQYLFIQHKLVDGCISLGASRMSACRFDDAESAHSMAQDFASDYETNYIIEPWYETGREDSL